MCYVRRLRVFATKNDYQRDEESTKTSPRTPHARVVLHYRLNHTAHNGQMPDTEYFVRCWL
ncbi:hypothetical protein BofuT4_P155800.1 [Botrytis cinerea T4]|uniref:Uncharacterized protein n=1 Tax=Botryotinia fuckeliana (strain T4) TaxID=999810 RepID=G2YVE1_BOTF4|nr:hypothetical protein BofuT4_P155800.1 [Botrytis cinerea T4]